MTAKARSPFDLEAFLTTANGGRSITKYKKGETIVSQGHPCEEVFFVQKGTCKMTVVSPEGKEAVVALHEKGAFFGEGCLNAQVRHLSTVTAFTDCDIMRFDKPTISSAIDEEPQFAEFFMSYLLTRNSRVEADGVARRSGNPPGQIRDRRRRGRLARFVTRRPHERTSMGGSAMSALPQSRHAQQPFQGPLSAKGGHGPALLRS